MFDIFTEKYTHSLELLYSTDIALPYTSTELIPLMYCIVDLSSIIANKNRDFANKQFITWALLLLDEEDKETLLSIFDERSELYAAILNREIQPRYDWLVSGAEKTDNPIINCCAAFGDIITNPFCANDYTDKTIRNIGIEDSVKFAITFKKFCRVMAELYNETYKLL